MAVQKKKIWRRVGKLFLVIVTSLIALLVISFIFLNTQAGKNFVRNQAVHYLQQKLKTKISIESIDYRLPQWITLNQVYIEDLKKDTLLYGEKLYVDLNMFKLLRGGIDIEKVYLKNCVANIYKKPNDSFFNYQFIVDAFSGKKKSGAPVDTTALDISLKKLILSQVGVKFNDEAGGSYFSAWIDSVDIVNKTFQPDRTFFEVDRFFSTGINFTMRNWKTPHPDSMPPAAENASSAYSFFISSHWLQAKNLHVLIDNQVSGLYYKNEVSSLYLSNGLYSLAQNRISADSMILAQSQIQFTSPKDNPNSYTVPDTTMNSSPWNITAKLLQVNNTKLSYNDVNKAQQAGLDPSHLELENLSAQIHNFKLFGTQTFAEIKDLKFKDKSGFQLDSLHINLQFTDTVLSARALYVKTPGSLLQNSFRLAYDSIAGISKYPQQSLVAANLVQSTLSFNDLYLLLPELKKQFPPEDFKNLAVSFNTSVRGNLKRLYLPILQLKGLSGSSIRASGTLYNLTNTALFAYDLTIFNSLLLKKDLLRFVPADNKAALENLPDLIQFSGQLKGDKNNVHGNIAVTGKEFQYLGNITLNNISNPDKLSFNTDFKSLTLNKKFIEGYLPPGINQQINLPPAISASGKFKADKNNFDAHLQVKSNYGPLTVVGFMKNIQTPQNAVYDLTLNTPGFNIGKLVKQDSMLGNLAGKFRAEGTGFDYKTMRSQWMANIDALDYNKYTYKNAKFIANFNNGILYSKAQIDDENIKLNYELDGNVTAAYPTLHGFINIDTIVLQSLHLYDDTLNLAGLVKIDLKNTTPRHVNGFILIDRLKLQLDQTHYKEDSIILTAHAANGEDSIHLRSGIADFTATGAFDYNRVGRVLQDYVNQYYKFNANAEPLTNVPAQQIDFTFTLKENPLVTRLVKGLQAYKEIHFSGDFNSNNTDSALHVSGNIPLVVYNGKRISKANIAIDAKNERLQYHMMADSIALPSNIFYSTKISGNAAHDSLYVDAMTNDKNNKPWFGISSSIVSHLDAYRFRLKDNLILNYEKWKVNDQNYIQYNHAGLIVHQFQINNDTASIRINSLTETPNSPIDMNIDNFNLKSISSFISSDTLFASGILDVKAKITDMNQPLPAFTGTASIDHFAMMQQPLGNLTAQAQKISAAEITSQIKLQGEGNDLTADLQYYLNNDQKQFDASLDIHQLNVKPAGAFSGGLLKNTSGTIHGNMKLFGRFSDPQWKGFINADTVRFALTQYNIPYLIEDQKINFDYPRIEMRELLVADSADNNAKIDGYVAIDKEQGFKLNLDVYANNFIIMNAQRAIDNQFYGLAMADADVSLRGSSEAPRIEGNVFIDDRSNITIVLPPGNYVKDEGKSVVRFIDIDTFNISKNNKIILPEAQKDYSSYLNYDLNLKIGKASSLTIIIDPNTGDELQVKGDALLNAGVDPGGNLILSGNYLLDEGYYILNYKFLQRRFTLQKGSSILFSGPPMSAQVDIKADYIANSSTKDLLSNEITSVNASLANAFNQKLPFTVELTLSGQINKPTISFDIKLPENNKLLTSELKSTIENKLEQIRADEASMNKQAFSLLLMNRFVGEQSADFFKGNEAGFSDLARQSVSQFISSALDQIASDLIKGVDIDLNLNSYKDYTTGGSTQRTDLNVMFSKSFLDDRLVVSLGTNIGIEGNDAAAKSYGSSMFRPDVTISYKLTKDGKYMIRGYNKNQYEVVLDGYVVETGLGFIVTLDYDKFIELFKKKKE